MELPTLLTSDLHLTDNPADDYRWKLFDFLADRCQAEGVKTLGILGDLTDAKDYHPSRLTNRIVEQIVRMRALVDEVIILEGNHDYLRKGHAYFEFLNHLPGIRFIVKPYEDLTGSKAGLWLPHTKTPMQDWKDWDFTHYNYVFMHQTAPGSIASNGQAMDGDALPDFGESKIYSGDIHVPQVIGSIENVGSPYHVHHGDNFHPRCVLLDRRGRAVDLHFDSIRRLSVKVRSLEELRRMDIKRGDHLKLTFELSQADKHSWAAIKRKAAEEMADHGVVLNDLSLKVAGSTVPLSYAGDLKKSERMSDAEVLTRFVTNEDLGGDALDVGLALLKG